MKTTVRKRIFTRATRTNSPTGNKEGTTLPPIGNNSMYNETSCKNFGVNVFVSFQRTEIIQINDITFFRNRFSNPTKRLRSTGQFRFQLILASGQWFSEIITDKKTNYSTTSEERTFLKIEYTEAKYSNKLVYDQIDTALVDMCFGNIMIA